MKKRRQLTMRRSKKRRGGMKEGRESGRLRVGDRVSWEEIVVVGKIMWS